MSTRQLVFVVVCIVAGTVARPAAAEEPPAGPARFKGVPEYVANFMTTEDDPAATLVELKNGMRIWVKKDACVYPYLKELTPAKFGPPEIEAPFNFRNRIYTRFHPEEGRRVIDLVGTGGKFLSPDRFLLPESVVPGEWLGVPHVNFEFVKDRKNLEAWVPTTKPIRIVWSEFEKYADDGTPLRKVETAYEEMKLRFEPLVEDLTKSDKVALYEGLPHQALEQELLQQELATKQTTERQEFPFYAELLLLKAKDVTRIQTLFSTKETFRPYQGPKSCGGFHPDFCLEFRDGVDRNQYFVCPVQYFVCLGCREVKLFEYGKQTSHYDLSPEAFDTLKQILTGYRKQRPKSALATF